MTRIRHHHTATHRTCYLCKRLQPNEAYQWRSVGTAYSACKECNKNHLGPKRSAREMGAEGTFTTAEWLALRDQHTHCPGCSRSWGEIPLPPNWTHAATRDHKIPLELRANTIENLIPHCRSCNAKKATRTWDEWMAVRQGRAAS